MNINEYKNPLTNQYVAPYGYHFESFGTNFGRIIWTVSPENYVIKKD